MFTRKPESPLSCGIILGLLAGLLATSSAAAFDRSFPTVGVAGISSVTLLADESDATDGNPAETTPSTKDELRASSEYVRSARESLIAKSDREPALDIADCNNNGVPDDQDIIDGTSLDTNGNGIPDECECLGAPCVISLFEATATVIPSTPGDGVFIEVFNLIGGGPPPRPTDLVDRTPDGTTLSPVVDFPHPGATVNVGQDFTLFFADTTVPPDEVAGLPASNFILRITGLLRVTSDLDLDPVTPEIDVRFGVGSDDGYHLTVGTTFFGETGDHGFGYWWFDANFEGEGLYPITLLFSANASGYSGLEFSWDTALMGVEILPQEFMYLTEIACDRKIEFEEYAAGTVVTDQYRDLGVLFQVFSGGLQITDAFPGEFVPVSGDRVFADPEDTPAQEGVVVLEFVEPGTDIPAGTDYFSCFIIDAEATGATITAFDDFEEIVFAGTYNAGGATQELGEISAPFIHRIEITLGQGTDTSAIDNICFNTPVIRDCNDNGIADEIDIDAGTSQDCTQNGIPDECDIASGLATDCDENGIPDECEIGEPLGHNCCETGHGVGCNDSTIQACVCAIDDYCCSGEWDSDCVDAVEGHACGSCTVENDCNHNGELDVCDIISGTSGDCNENDIPDECDIDEGFSEDCNTNGIPDDCDIVDATSTDCDGNGIPDECEITQIARIRLSQETAPGAGDFDDNVLGLVDPFDTTLSSDGYYRYDLGDAASFNGTEPALVLERSHLFLVDATDGLSLFVVHDKPGNSNGGVANTSYSLSGDPDGAAITVVDDSTANGDTYTGAAGDSLFTAVHTWSPCCTDGLALTGFNGVWTLLVEFTSAPTSMDSWMFYVPTGDPIELVMVAGQRVRLDIVFEGGAADCNSNSLPDHCDLAAGTSADCNETGIPDECEVPPIGVGPDCNEDLVPDECQLDGNDCNENIIPDDCDIAEGLEEDCNANLIPDACDILGTTPFNVALGKSVTATGFYDVGCDTFPPDRVTDGRLDDTGSACDWSFWLTRNSVLESFTVDLGDVFAIQRFELQNTHNRNFHDRATNEFSIFVSLDGIDFGQAVVDDQLTNTLGTPYPGPILFDNFDIQTVIGRYVQFQVDSYHGAGGGLNEIRVIAGAVSADCNENSIPDECDIDAGTSQDCNGNMLPDECELASGTGFDCNENTILDDCDIAAGTSEDCNNNDIPDECDIVSGSQARFDPIDFSALHNARLQDLDGGYPAGEVTLGGVPFNIPDVPNNYWHSAGAAGDNPRSIDIDVNRLGVQEVHTIINSSWGQPGPTAYAWLEFFGADGAYYRKDLIGNEDIRDFNQYTWTNIINGTTTINVVTVGAHRLDKQQIVLPVDFRDEILQTIRLSDNGGDNFQRVFLAGVTAVVGQSPDCNENGIPDECELGGQGLPFFDDFEGGPSALWGNERGSWVETSGVYATQYPSNLPPTFSSLPFELTNFAIEVEINAVNDGGVWLRSDATGNNAVLLVMKNDQLYWHTFVNGSFSGILNPASGVFTPGSDVHVRVEAIGDTYSAFANGSPTPATTLTYAVLSSGRVGLYDYSAQTFDNVWVIPDLNRDGVIDEQDEVITDTNDCNSNSIPDDCDLADGISEDCNTNDIPDECEIGTVVDQWASSVIDYSSQYSTGGWSAAQALGEPNTFGYGDISTSWAASARNETLEYLTLGYDQLVFADGATIRETWGNGFVYQVDVLDQDDVLHTVWTGVDPSPPGSPVNFRVDWPLTGFAVKGVKVYVDTNHDLNTWEEIDAIQLHGRSARDLNDCNGNSIPDDCDIAAGTSEDCNSNALPDECDVAHGTSTDCNSNDLPDECETTTSLVELDFNSGVDSRGNAQGDLVFDGVCGLQVTFTDDESDGSPGGNADGVHINDIGYGNAKAGTGDLVLGAYNTFDGDNNYHTSGIVASFSRGVELVRFDDTDDDTTPKTLYAFDQSGTLIGQTAPASQIIFQIDTSMTGGVPIYSIEFDSAPGTAGGANDGIVFTIDNFYVEGRLDEPQRVLMVNVTGSYNADGQSIHTTLLNAGAEATYVNLASVGDVAAVLAEYTFEQIWVFDLSSSSDNYTTDWQAIADWFNADPSRVIICDGRMISSYWSGRWETEGQKLTENYYENMRIRGGGILLGTDHTPYHSGINSINSQIGLDPFVGEFSLQKIPVDVGSPLMNTPNDMGTELWDDSSPGQTPYGLQPNGRILYTVAWHSGNPDTPGISATIQGGIGFRVDIVAPADGATFFLGEPITFTAVPTNGDAPFTYTWSSDVDGDLGTGETLVYDALSVGQHVITVLAEDSMSRDDDDSITITVAAAPDLEVTDIDVPCAGGQGLPFEVSWTVTNNGSSEVTGTWTDQIRLSDDAQIGGDRALGTFEHTATLAIGESYTRTETVTLPGDALEEHWIGVFTDLDNDVEEGSGEGNNGAIDDASFYLHTPDVVSLCSWSEVDYGSGSAGDWIVAEDGLSVRQRINGEPTFFVSDFDLAGSQFQGSFMVESGAGDDDYIGFVFGFKGLGGVAAGEGFYLFSWKGRNQTTGEAGFKVLKIIGTSPDLWDADQDQDGEQIIHLVSQAGDNADGWQHGVEYDFFLTYQDNGNIRVIIRRSDNGDELWNTGTITDESPLGAGKVGFYNYSQCCVVYSGFTQVELQPPLAVAGGPYLFDTVTDTVTLDATGSSDPDGVTGTFDDIDSLQWDLGNDGIDDDVDRVNAEEIIDFAAALDKGLAIATDVAVGLEVWDIDRLSSVDIGTIRYNSTAPTADAGGPYGPIGPGEVIQLDGLVDDIDLPLGVGEALAVEWDHAPANSASEIGDGFASTVDATVSYETLLPGVSQHGEMIYLNVTDSAGLVASASADITLLFSDLVVESATPPSDAVLGEPTEFSWVVRNTGGGAATSAWRDVVYLSVDEVFDGGDLPVLIEQAPPPPLPGGQGYLQAADVTFPLDQGLDEGDYYVFVVADGGADQYESDETNNVSAPYPITLHLPLMPDLVLVEIEAPAMVVYGDEIEIRWVVRNVGEGTAVGSWLDRIWISTDDQIGSDGSLVDFTFPGSLGPGESYERIEPVTIRRDVGEYWFVIKTDHSNNVMESGDDSNNTAIDDASFTVEAIPIADLVVTSITPPSDGVLSGQTTLVSWIVTNAGTAATAATQWRDQIFVSATPDLEFGGPGGDQQICNELGRRYYANNPSYLEPGGSYSQSVEINLPDDQSGPYFIYVIADRPGCHRIAGSVPESSNINNISRSDAFDIVLGPQPDLQVTSLFFTSTTFSGENFTVAWGDTNAGTAVTDTGRWVDSVYLSTNQLPTVADDILLGQLQRVGDPLAQGEVDDALSVTRQIDPQLYGSFFVKVRVDTSDVVSEAGFEGNNILSSTSQVNIILSPTPDLDPADATVSTVGMPGHPVSVSYSVSNVGAEPPVAAAWDDNVYLSADDVLDPATDVLLGTSGHSTQYVAPGVLGIPDYFASVSGVLPPSFEAGQYYAIVLVDAEDELFEFDANDNNIQISDPFDVMLTPTDLEMFADKSVPSSGTPGEPLELSWEVINTGLAVTPVLEWTDGVYFSHDEFLSGSDQFLGSADRAGELEPGLSYQGATSVTVPSVAAGSYYLLFVADNTNDVYEQAPGENNNVDAVKFDVNPASETFIADLTVTNVSVPATADDGQPIPVSWTVKNISQAATRASSWHDALYLSVDESISPDDVPLGTIGHNGALAPDTTYVGSRTITLPLGKAGPRRILVHTDAANGVFEVSDNNNIASGSITIEIDGAPPVSANLTVTEVSTPDTINGGENTRVIWTVKNTGDAPTGAAWWRDSVYLSNNTTLETTDELLGTADHYAALAAGESRVMDQEYFIPHEASGSLFILVMTDSTNVVDESGQDHDNSLAAGADTGGIDVEPAPPANLVVTNVEILSEATAGQNTTISWTVANGGEGVTSSSYWVDGVFLSRDRFLNTSSDPFLGDYPHTEVLGSGEQRLRSTSFQIPLGTSGPYYVFVVANRDNRVFENGVTADNTLVSDSTIEVVLPPVSDLAVTSVSGEGTAILGEPWSFTWELTNVSDANIAGYWSDSVFLSEDEVWDIDDVFVGRFQHPAVGLLPDDSTPGSGQAPIPAINPGEYYVIVRSDVFNQIPESDVTNNVGVSAGTLHVSTIPLTLEVPFDGLLPEGADLYFALSTPAGETVRISLDHSSPTAWTQLYIRKDHVPTIGQFDIVSQAPSDPDQIVIIPTTEDATYYILARATSGTFVPDGVEMTLLAETVPFNLDIVEPTHVGNGEWVTLRLYGSRFREGSYVTMFGPNDSVINASVVEVPDGQTMHAGFNLSAAEYGLYHVLITDPAGPQTILINAVTVEPMSYLFTATEIIGPDAVRIGSAGSFQVRVRNFSNTDMPHAVVLFSLNDHGSHRITTTEPGSVQVAGETYDLGELEGDFVKDGRRWYPVFVTGVWADSTRDYFFTVEVGRDTPSGPLGLFASHMPYHLHEQWYLRSLLTADALRDRLVLTDVNDWPPELVPVVQNLLLIAPDEDAWYAAFLGAMAEFGLWTPFYDGAGPPADAGVSQLKAKMAALPGMAAFVANFATTIPGGEELTIDADIIAGIGEHILQDNTVIEHLWPDPCDLCSCCGIYARDRDEERDGLLVLRMESRKSSGDDDDGDGVNPTDPNEKHGPEGYGEAGFVGVREPIPYEVFFENIAEAGANAAVVTITDKLDSSLRIGRFRVGNIQFGERIVEVPGNTMSFQGLLDLTEESGVLLEISAGVNAATNEAFWILRSLDPMTGEVPADPYAGFLPPNDENGSGEGSVKYTIEPKPDVPTGTVISNAATIVFDTQPPIETNVVTNTLDVDPPTSQINQLESVSPSEIELVWTGQDAPGGSGLGSFAIFASMDGGPYVPLITETTEQSAIFIGQPGHFYAFYSIATDNVGNAEELPPMPDAMTTVSTVDTLDVVGFIVNDAQLQRSNVVMARVAFTAATNMEDLISSAEVVNAVSLWYRNDGGGHTQIPLGTTHYGWDAAGNVLTLDLTVDGLGGSSTTLLADGNYEVWLDTTMITTVIGTELTDGDGTPDGVYRFGHIAEHRLFRLAGDGTGDRVVNFLDLQKVRNAWLTFAGGDGFDPNADMNSDGLVNFLDLQMVRNNWLTLLGF